jgi:hypothetical protein
MHSEFPYLKFLGGNTLVVGLNDRDFVQKPADHLLCFFGQALA